MAHATPRAPLHILPTARARLDEYDRLLGFDCACCGEPYSDVWRDDSEHEPTCPCADELPKLRNRALAAVASPLTRTLMAAARVRTVATSGRKAA